MIQQQCGDEESLIVKNVEEKNNEEGIVDPEEIQLDQISATESASISTTHLINSSNRRRGHGQTVIFPNGPPPPLHLIDDDLPVCDSSGQVQLSLLAEEDSKYSSQSRLQQPNQAALSELRLKAANNKITAPLKKEIQHNQGRNHALATSLDHIVKTKPSQQSTAIKKTQVARSSSSKFFDIFPKLNDQAIDLLVRQSEPETALDVLRQALSELNQEKGIREGMPHYRHKLITHNHESKVTQATGGKGSTPKQVIPPGSDKKTIENNTTKKMMQASNSSTKAGVTPISPKVLKSSQAAAVSCFLEGSAEGTRQQKGAKQIQGSYSHQVPKRAPAAKRINNSTKCASSNSTCEPSTNNLVSSLKSSLVTTPASPNIAALSQKELKDRTREPNLIVCLYYNLACCYQRLGLLEESVEYLELASDQLEDTVQFFEAQEDSLIKSRQIRQNQQQQVRAAIAQYATEQPHRSLAEAAQIESEQYKTVQQNQSRLLPNSGKMQNNSNNQQGILNQDMKKKKNMNLPRQLSTGSSQIPTSQPQAGKKRKEFKREKISIKDCSAQQPQDQIKNSPPSGSSAEHLNKLLRKTLNDTDQVTLPKTLGGSTNLLQRMSQGASKLLQTKEAAAALLQVSGDFLTNLHNSAEQLVQKSTASMLPQSTKANQLQFASFTNNYSSIIEKNSSSGRNVSPVTTTSLPPESTVFSFNNNPTGTITVEQLLAEKMHKTRYQCKMNLQICALQSQLGKHQDALIYGRRAAQICYKLIKSAQMLCKRYVQQIQRHIQARQAKAVQQGNQMNQNQNTSLMTGAAAMVTLPDQNTSRESPPSRQIQLAGSSSSQTNFLARAGAPRHQKAFTEVNDSFEDDYQAAQFYRKPKTRIETASNSSTYTLSTSKQIQQNVLKGCRKSLGGGLKRPRSSCSSNGSSRSSNTSQKGLTRLRLSRRSTAKLGAGCSTKHGQMLECGSRSSKESSHNQSCGRESSTESLDRIHTFNLKNSAGRRLSESSTVINGGSETTYNKSSGAAGVYQNLGPETSNTIALGSKVDGLSIATSTAANKLKQIDEENKSPHRAYTEDANLDQLAAKQQKKSAELSGSGRQTHHPLNAARNVYVEESVKVLESLIIQADPLLQELASIVKEFEDKSQKSAIDRDQEMIKKYGQIDFRDRRKRLKISFTTLKELVNIEKDQRFKLNVRNTLGVKNSQDWIFNLNIGNVMHLNMMKEQELNAKIENTHELTKDTMLEKVVLITSAYFCIATEIRFILQKDLLDVKLITKKDSESYHAKALHVALLFLPEDCPLSQYINQTYCKNYLQPKLKLQKQRNAYISQKMAKQHQSRQKQLQQNMADKEHNNTKNVAEVQQSSQKRPATSLLRDMGSKLLISTKSYEGLSSQHHDPLFVIPGSSKTTMANNITSSTKAHQHHQANTNHDTFRKSGATPDLTTSKKSNQAISSSQQNKKVVGSEQRMRQPNKVSRDSTKLTCVMASQQQQTSAKASSKQSSLKHQQQRGGITKNLQHQRGHYPSTSLGYQPVLLSHHRNTPSVMASSNHYNSTRRIRSPQNALKNSHHYTNTGTGLDSVTKEDDGSRIVRDSSSVRKIKIDLGVICNQSIERKTQQLYNTHQRSSSIRRLSKKTSQGSGTGGTSLAGSSSLKPRSGKVASANHQKTKINHQQVKQSLGDCSNSVAGITTATINPPTTHPSTQQTLNHQHHLTASLSTVTMQQRKPSTSGPQNPLSKPPHQSSASTTTMQEANMLKLQSQQAIMLAALKLLQKKQAGSGVVGVKKGSISTKNNNQNY